MNNKRAFFLIGLIVTVFLSMAMTPTGDIFRCLKDYTVKADNEVGGSVFVLGGDLTVEKDATVLGDVLVIFGNLKVDGRINGNVGIVFGNGDMSASSSVIGDCGVVYGSLNAATGVVLGETGVIEAPANFSTGALLPIITTTVIGAAVVIYLVSCLIYFMFPRRTKNMADSLKAGLGRKFLIGFLINLAMIPLIIVLVITVIGVFAIPLVILVYLLVNMFANVALSFMVGRKISGGPNENAGSPYIYLLSGVLTVFLISIIPVIGWLAYYAACCIALGAAVDTRLGEVV